MTKRQVFGLVVLASPSVKPVGYKIGFASKRSEKNKVLSYKSYLQAQGFLTKRPGIDYKEIYYLTIDVTTFYK